MYLNSTFCTNEAQTVGILWKRRCSKEYHSIADSYTIFIFSYYHENIVDIGGIVDCRRLRGGLRGRLGWRLREEGIKGKGEQEEC